MTGKNGVGVMMHELTFNELVAESQWKLQSDKITEKKPGSYHTINTFIVPIIPETAINGF